MRQVVGFRVGFWKIFFSGVVVCCPPARSIPLIEALIEGFETSYYMCDYVTSRPPLTQQSANCCKCTELKKKKEKKEGEIQ